MLLGKIMDGVLFLGLGIYFILLGSGKFVGKKIPKSSKRGDRCTAPC